VPLQPARRHARHARQLAIIHTKWLVRAALRGLSRLFAAIDREVAQIAASGSSGALQTLIDYSAGKPPRAVALNELRARRLCGADTTHECEWASASDRADLEPEGMRRSMPTSLFSRSISVSGMRAIRVSAQKIC
jgi:hypothetical protein